MFMNLCLVDEKLYSSVSELKYLDRESQQKSVGNLIVIASLVATSFQFQLDRCLVVHMSVVY